MMTDKSGPQPTVSIVVPTSEWGREFGFCMASLATLNPPPDEIIVVADGVAAQPIGLPNVRILAIDGPAGPALARNTGAAAALCDLLFFVDSDVTVPESAVEHLRELFRREPGIDAVIGSYDDAPAAPGFVSQYRNLLHHYVHQTGEENATTFWGACGAIRREAFHKVGGFSKVYARPSIEDIELGYRLLGAGYRIRLDKTLQVKHLKPWSLVSMVRTDLFNRAIPWTRLILRDRMLVDDLNLRVENRISAILVCLGTALMFGALWLPWLLLGAAVAFLGIALLNLPLYRFFARKRGAWFAVRVVPMNLLYHLYSAMGLVIGMTLHMTAIFSRREVDWRPSSSRSIPH